MTTTTAQSTTVDHLPPARTAAWVAAICLFANGLLALFYDVATLSDHTRGPGMISRITTGLAFVAGAGSLALLTPVTGWRRWLWTAGPAGLALAGATMLAVPVVGAEPPPWLFLLAVVPTLFGTVAAGVLGAKKGTWPWWTGTGLALLLPIMFTLPFNGFLMAGVWMAIALTARSR